MYEIIEKIKKFSDARKKQNSKGEMDLNAPCAAAKHGGAGQVITTICIAAVRSVALP